MKLSGSIVLTIFIVGLLLSNAFAQNNRSNHLIINIPESEVSELDLKRELLIRNRAEFDLNSGVDTEEMLALLSQKLNDAGWTSSWQEVRNEKHIADFFTLGRANLRLELNQTSSQSYRLLLYRY